MKNLLIGCICTVFVLISTKTCFAIIFPDDDSSSHFSSGRIHVQAFIGQSPVSRSYRPIVFQQTQKWSPFPNHQRPYQNVSQVQSKLKVSDFQIDAVQIIATPDLNNTSDRSSNQNDIMESDESLLEEILALDKMLQAEMNNLRRPGSDGSLFPTPNFAFLPDIGPMRQLFQWGTKTASSYAVCHACRVSLGLLLLKARTKTSLPILIEKATFACTFFNVASDEVCTGLVNRFGPTVHYILTNRLQLTANTFCGIVLQDQGCASPKLQTEWNIDLSPPPLYGNRRHGPRRELVDNIDNAVIPRDLRTLKVLHLTDIHLDPAYRPGANTDCKTELCCRIADGVGDFGNRAGYYGDYRRCDLPLHSLEEALHHISTTHPDIQLIYMTGDLVPHNIWSTDVRQNIETINVATAVIRKYFPRTKLIPVLGNHDVHPVNLFSPPDAPVEFSTDYIYAATAKAWGHWIPRESLHTFLLAGYYEVPITQGFRVIVLNTNLCYTYNFWQVYEHHDPGGQLQWLTRELHKSEERGELVHILGHVPPSQEECWTVWSRNFYAIISRFSSTVKAQFYGHTHFDEFQLYYHPEDKGRAISPLWLGASLTPFTNLNPGYKIFTVDGARGSYSSWNVLDHETWIYNLTEANENSYLPPRWFKLYKATEAYKIPNVLPSSLNIFIHRMSSDQSAFNEYYRNYHKAAEVALKIECDTACRKRILCRIVTPQYLDQSECLKIQSEVDGIVLPQKIFERASTEPPPTISTTSDGGILGIFGK